MSEPPAGAIRVPSMRRRFAAFMFDGLILAFCASVVLGAYVSVFGPAASGGGAIALLVVVAIAASVLPVVHEGGSFGQVAAGLRVVRLDGRRLSPAHALARQATFLLYLPWGALLGGFIGVLAAAVAGATGEAVLAAVSAGALVGLMGWMPMAIVGNSLGLAIHDALSRSIVVQSGDARPFGAVLVPRSARQAKREWAGIGVFALTAYLVATTSALALPSPTGDLSAAGAPAATDVMVTGTVYVPKGQLLSVTPTQPTTSGVSGRPRGLASLGAGRCSGRSCDVLANARVRFVAPSRYGWQALPDAGSATTADAQGSYRMILPQRYAAAPAPTYVMATDPGERLAVIAEVGVNQQRPGVGITLDVDHSTTYLALLRCPGGGTLGTCGSSAGDPSAEQLEKAIAARFTELGNAGDLRTPERTIGALVASPAVLAALEAAVAAGHAPTAAPAAIVAATRASPPLVAVTGPKSPPPSSAPPRSPAAAVQSPPRTAAPAAAVQSRAPTTAPAARASTAPPALVTTPAGRPPTVEPGCPSVYDGTYIGQAIYQVDRFGYVNKVWTERTDPPRALNLTVVLECTSVSVKERLVYLRVKAAGADHSYFGPLGVAVSGSAQLPLDLPQARAASHFIEVVFPSDKGFRLSSLVVPSFDASRIASELYAGGRYFPWSVLSWNFTAVHFPDVESRLGGLDSTTTYLSWSLTKTAR